MNKENYFISCFHNKHIGDDAAVIGKYVYSKDAFFENVHYKKSWLSFKQIAQKAMIVNISDAIAMNARPKYALLSVAMPSSMSKNEMKELADGFKETAAEYGVEIIGGDTLSNTKLDITVTIIASLNSQTKVLRRSKVRVGDMLAYTGILGSSAKDLKKLFNLGKIHTNSKFVKIELRQSFISNSARLLNAGMDISDGLLSDLDKMTTLNSIGVKFYKRLSKAVTCSGEEYEMLIAFDRRQHKALKRKAQQSRTKLNIFGEARRSRFTNSCKAHHF